MILYVTSFYTQLCTLEFESRRASYYWLLESLDLYHPYVWEYSRLSVTNTVLSKRKVYYCVSTLSYVWLSFPIHNLKFLSYIIVYGLIASSLYSAQPIGTWKVGRQLGWPSFDDTVRTKAQRLHSWSNQHIHSWCWHNKKVILFSRWLAFF